MKMARGNNHGRRVVLTTSTGGSRHLGMRLGMALLLGLLGGCATSSGTSESLESRPPAAVARQPVTQGEYRVRRGDTLYSIASRHGWEWQALAARNGIPAPYTIRVGQVIRFSGAGTVVAMPAASPVPAQTVNMSPAPVVAPAPAPLKPATTTGSPAPVVSPTGWAWPAEGQLIALFSSNSSLNKGIDIAGELGQPVVAASAGSVVYAGSGLRGYGELVIIKHSDTYVSAYGHNRRLLVREGQQVKAGQTIAEMGATGTDRVKLHFEIRRQGKPVDPLQYLPRR